MLIKINAVELRKALTDIEAAERNGFMFCNAILEPSQLNGMGHLQLDYSDIEERAHPTDGNCDWGRFQGVTRRNRFVNGKLEPIQNEAVND
jgi:hypothetical protein